MQPGGEIVDGATIAADAVLAWFGRPRYAQDALAETPASTLSQDRRELRVPEQKRRSHCCEFFRSVNSNEWAALNRFRLTYG